MPIRTNAPGTFDDTDMSLLESVLSQLDPENDERREQFALRLIHLFQSGMTDPDELLRRMKGGQS